MTLREYLTRSGPRRVDRVVLRVDRRIPFGELRPLLCLIRSSGCTRIGLIAFEGFPIELILAPAV